MTTIANPIYDIVFKFLMEDNRVAKILLSALLKKEIVELEMRQHEYTAMQQTRISLFRIDFCAKIREENGEEHLVLIELQKTWLITETLRFRQYLGTQYLNRDSMKKEDNSAFGLPIISVYILGHLLGNIKEPVIYVRRRYLDYDDHVLEQRDPFIESLTHDSIIVQIPCLKGNTRNRLERLLNLFDQEYKDPNNEHFLNVDDDENYMKGDEQLMLLRLVKAAASPEIRRAMDVEDEILSEIEARDTLLMQKDAKLEQKDVELEQKDIELEQKDVELEQKNTELEQKNAELKQKDCVIKQTVQLLLEANFSPEDIARQLSLPLEQILHLKSRL